MPVKSDAAKELRRRRRRVDSAEMTGISSFALRAAEQALAKELKEGNRPEVVMKLVSTIATIAGSHAKSLQLGDVTDRLKRVERLLEMMREKGWMNA